MKDALWGLSKYRQQFDVAALELLADEHYLLNWRDIMKFPLILTAFLTAASFAHADGMPDDFSPPPVVEPYEPIEEVVVEEATFEDKFGEFMDFLVMGLLIIL